MNVIHGLQLTKISIPSQPPFDEGQSEYPPAAMVPKLAGLLGVTADELLGIQALKKQKRPDTRLERRYQQIAQLPAKDRRQLLQLIDTFVKAAQLTGAA